MAARRQLSRAPIAEAVVDFVVRFDASQPSPDLDRFERRVVQNYPDKKIRFETTVKLNVGQGGTETTVNKQGFMFGTADGKYVIHCKPDGVGFSRLAPYQDWSNLKENALKAWSEYCAEFRPSRIQRLSTRFINKLTLPPSLDFDDYLTIAPRLPLEAPQHLSAFSTSTMIPYIADDSVAFVRTRFDAPGEPDKPVIVILDIDVIRDCDIATDDDQQVEHILSLLHETKNNLFFGSLTETAVELFR